MNRFEKRKTAIDRAIREQIDEYKSIYNRSDAEDRDPSEEERLDIESHLKAPQPGQNRYQLRASGGTGPRLASPALRRPRGRTPLPTAR